MTDARLSSTVCSITQPFCTVVPKRGTLRRFSLVNLDAEIEWTAVPYGQSHRLQLLASMRALALTGGTLSYSCVLSYCRTLDMQPGESSPCQDRRSLPTSNGENFCSGSISHWKEGWNVVIVIGT